MYVRQRKTIRKVKIFHIPNHKMHSTGRDLRVEAVRCQTTKGLIIFINFKRDDRYSKMSNFIGLDFFYVFCRTHGGTSSSHPMLNYSQNGSSPRNLFTSSSTRSQTHNKSTQTPDNIERETRRHKLRSLKINFNNVPTPSLNFKLGFLNQKKRSNLTANAVATEQKASKVLECII